MKRAAKEAVGDPPTLHVVADAGYSNGEPAEACEAQGIVPHVPANRAVNHQGNGQLFDRSQFQYDEKTDTFRCPAQQTLTRKQLSRKDRAVYYAAQPEACSACALKARCTNGAQRLVSRHLHEGALQRMQHRATPEVMRLRRSTVEHPFASLKYHIFEVAHLRPPAIPAARTHRSADRDQPSNHGLQPKTHVQRARRDTAAGCARRVTVVLRSRTHEPKTKKRRPETPNVAFSCLLLAVS